MTDIMIYESGNSGEISLKNGDVETTDAIFNQIYLAHFGGNLEASTTGEEIEGNERMDWFGNFFLQEESQMNSSLERTLNEVSLNSFGIELIKIQAENDVEFLESIGDIITSVSMVDNDKVKISHKINQNTISFIWDATKNEVIEEKII